MAEETLSKRLERQPFALHGWIGLLLVAVFWWINWTLPGPRTFWAFFPLWAGFCLTIDAINLRRTGTSLIARSWRKYIGLFLISAPVWWLFEVLNWRVQNWHYLGRELLNTWQYILVSSINFSIVIPAVFGAAELVSGLGFVRRMKTWLVIKTDRKTTLVFFLLGWMMLIALLLWPRYCFPFLWLSVYFILEPLNVWFGNRNLGLYTQRGDWRPVVSLFLGALLTGFFWEMWNYLAYPKWIYTVPFVGTLKIFEMPLLGYGGYLPFACELFALYHLVTGFLGQKRTGYLLPTYLE
jgi:hypothetical protein